MTQMYLFRFTPSMMTGETLEQLLVQRQALAQRLSDLIRESVTTQNKHHKLLIGPRGMGKTHLVALTYHHVKAMDDLRENLWIAWLNEEEWGVDSFLDLLLRICRALQAEYPALFPFERVEALYQMSQAEAQRAAELLLKEFVGGRTLVLLVENLDELFKGMGDNGQRQFRSFLQETAFSTILATSQSLFNGVSRQTSPFFGFFSITHLQEFSVEDATLLLKNIAAWKQDKALVDFIETPAGRARVRTVNHLAGGNPRIYVIFSEFLTRDSLDELVEPFLKTLDELTPYYQARIGALSTQQRKIVEFLCDHAAPATVKEIAKRCFMSQQTASSQLKDLKEKGYVLPDPLGPTGRDTYYELKEPLMRLCLEVKKSRTGPIRLLIDFLRLWYPVSELKQQLNLCQPEAIGEREYLQRAIQAAENTEDPRVKECEKAFNMFMSVGKYEQALNVSDELVALQPSSKAYGSRAVNLLILNRPQEALENFNLSLQQDHCPTATCVHTWIDRSYALCSLGRYEEAIHSIEQIVTMFPNSAASWLHLAGLYKNQGCNAEAISTLDKAIQAVPEYADLWIARGTVLESSERFQEALINYKEAARLNPHDENTWIKQAFMLRRLGRLSEALRCYNRGIRRNPQTEHLWYAKGTVLLELKLYDQALACFDNAIELGDETESECVYYDRALAVIMTQSFSEGIKYLDHVLDTYPIEQEHLALHTRVLFQALLRSAQAQIQFENIEALVRAYDKHTALNALSSALMQSLPTIFEPHILNSTSQAWYENWKAVSAKWVTFTLPLRLMNSAIRYETTKDKRILLELPSEERKILESLLQASEEQTDGNNEHAK